MFRANSHTGEPRVLSASEARRAFAEVLDQASFGTQTIIRRPGMPDILIMRAPDVPKAQRALGVDDNDHRLVFDLLTLERGVAEDFSDYL